MKLLQYLRKRKLRKLELRIIKLEMQVIWTICDIAELKRKLK